MALHLSVPAREDKPPIPAETRPKNVQVMVDTLSFSHPVSAAQALLEPLVLLNRQAVGADSRLKLMEIYRPAVLNVAHELAAHCAGHSLPLPDDAMAAAATARALLTELAYGYKLAILDQINRVFAIGGNKTLTILAQRAIHALDQLLQVSYYTYTAAPEGVWAEIHRIYMHAAQQGVYDIELMDTGGIRPTSVNQTYKNALLLALANPHRLPPTDLSSVCDYIARFGHLVQLLALGKPENPAGVFLVQLKSDQIPVPLSKHKGAADMRTDILLITVELARKVSDHLAGLQDNISPSKLGLPEGAVQRHYQDLLSHLVKHWALAPKRTSSRLAKNESINLIVGLESVHYYLNGEKDLSETSQDEDESEETLNFTGKPVKKGLSNRNEPSRWLVVNESAGGMALSKFPGTLSTVQVGDLLGLRSDRDAQWNLGVVRRASSNDTGELEIGTQMVAPHAKASAVRPENGDVFVHALLLPELPALKQPATLVTKGGVYQPARVLELKADPEGKAVRILATRLIERTNSFERFQFSLL